MPRAVPFQSFTRTVRGLFCPVQLVAQLTAEERAYDSEVNEDVDLLGSLKKCFSSVDIVREVACLLLSDLRKAVSVGSDYKQYGRKLRIVKTEAQVTKSADEQ